MSSIAAAPSQPAHTRPSPAGEQRPPLTPGRSGKPARPETFYTPEDEPTAQPKAFALVALLIGGGMLVAGFGIMQAMGGPESAGAAPPEEPPPAATSAPSSSPAALAPGAYSAAGHETADAIAGAVSDAKRSAKEQQARLQSVKNQLEPAGSSAGAQ